MNGWLRRPTYTRWATDRPNRPHHGKLFSFFFFFLFFFPFDLTPHLLFLHLFPPLHRDTFTYWVSKSTSRCGSFFISKLWQRKIKRYLIEIVTDRSLTVNTLIGQKEGGLFWSAQQFAVEHVDQNSRQSHSFQSEMNHVNCNPLCMYEIDEETEILKAGQLSQTGGYRNFRIWSKFNET